MSGSRRVRGPADPGRRERIARAAIRVVQDLGLAGLTHRAVAAAADVNLGSTTYHFASKEDLLGAAMVLATEDYRAKVAEWAEGLEPARLTRSIALHIAQGTLTPTRRRELSVGMEMYFGGLRFPQLRDVAAAWDDVMRDVLRQYIAEPFASGAYALAYGLWVSALAEDSALDVDQVEAVIAPMVAAGRST